VSGGVSCSAKFTEGNTESYKIVFEVYSNRVFFMF